MSGPPHHDLRQDGGNTLRHGAVALTVAAGVTAIRPATPTRRRIQLFNATAAGTGSTVYVGHNTDVNGAALAAANGWPLSEEYEEAGNHYYKIPANILELFTKDAIYGLAVGANATVKFIEEVN